jgi:predicted peptidase
MTQIAQHFDTLITMRVRLDYLLYLPPGFDDDPGQRWPLILFLHGSGERGDDIELVKLCGIPHNLEQGHDLPFIVLSPQCPAESHWSFHLEALKDLLTAVAVRYRVDESRMYLTGMSMGGAGAWLLAAAFPERFAALAPICGRIVPLPLPRLKNLPIWAFHGDADEIVPVSDTQRTVDALKAISANVKLTIYPGVGHDSWTPTYNNPALYEWFLSHKRSESVR